jgi:hypothetical protein
VGIQGCGFYRGSENLPGVAAGLERPRCGQSTPPKDGKTGMAKSHKKRRSSLLRRLFYCLVVASGGGGGWLLRDHPRIQALWILLGGKPAADAPRDANDSPSLAAAVVDLLKPAEDYRRPGTYQVTIPQVKLDPSLFKSGHTVDIQARVLKVDLRGHSSTVWETKLFGERLAVAGKDELSAGWPQRPFVIDWNPGERVMVEVYDRRPGLFVDPKRFVLAPADPEPREFPLRPGTFPLRPAQKADAASELRNNHIVVNSQRVGDLPPREMSQAEERPIVIK